MRLRELMISVFVRELQKYRKSEIFQLLGCSEKHANSIFQKLRLLRILKSASNDLIPWENAAEFVAEDIEYDAGLFDDNLYYTFNFVGVIVVEDCVLKCYPKYIAKNHEPIEELKQALKVIEKSCDKQQYVNFLGDTNDSSSVNILSIFLFLLQDYFENGVYTNTEEIIESNGLGEINWDKTINETFVFLSNNRPYYMDLRTRKRITDDYDYFKRLHECILTNASMELKRTDLLDIFDITEVDLSVAEIKDFGSKEYIISRIEKELNTQFVTRKQMVLKAMYAYINETGTLYSSDSISLYGTTSFNLVWEKVCTSIFNNQLGTKLGNLRLPVPLKDDYDSESRLIDLIERPLWTATERRADETLKPDLISIKGNQFIIFDAKYYNAHLELGKRPQGQPGIESVTKQYMYQMAYRDFIIDHAFAKVVNCFLMPTENSSVTVRGEVRLGMISNFDPELQDIKVRFIPAKKAYDLYLSDSKMDLDELML